ncbi:MAG: 23S rRNA (adenine(2503)-C(2))-methyltransferase RlmN [Phycisphaerae bacterium]
MTSSVPLVTIRDPQKRDPSRSHLLGMLPEEVAEFCRSLDEPAYRGDQLLQWVYARNVSNFSEMLNLSKAFRAQLAANAAVFSGVVAQTTRAADGTHKLLVSFDGATVESVWIPEADRDTACISSQVGCPVGCKFCASGLDGVERNLTAGEIVEQVMRVRDVVRRAKADPQSRVTNIVFMGMGEPLANYEQVIRALRIINHEKALAIGARRITISTVGLPAQIRKLAAENLQVNLALSLHAPEDQLRRELIPWGKVPIVDLIAACRDYFDKTGREITLEYILLRGINMDAAAARALAKIAKSLRCNLNLLRYNPVPGLPFERPSAEESFAFQERLRSAGVNAHMRRSRGSDIDAACGQLRRAAQSPAAVADHPEQERDKNG